MNFFTFQLENFCHQAELHATLDHCERELGLKLTVERYQSKGPLRTKSLDVFGHAHWRVLWPTLKHFTRILFYFLGSCQGIQKCKELPGDE